MGGSIGSKEKLVTLPISIGVGQAEELSEIAAFEEQAVFPGKCTQAVWLREPCPRSPAVCTPTPRLETVAPSAPGRGWGGRVVSTHQANECSAG